MNLNSEPKVIGMANALDLDVSRPVESILAYCRNRVALFRKKAKRISNIDDLQRLVCKCLNLEIREVWSDEDLSDLSKEYLEAGDIGVFGAIKTQINADTFGMLAQLMQPAEDGRPRFVAFIDCRDGKHQRRVFTIWHEIAHCLTTKSQLALPLRRSTTLELIEKDPVEKLTDIIAGQFAFYDPLFRPILESELGVAGRLTFQAVERVRQRFNPDASFISTLNACVASVRSPVILIEAGPTLKSSQRRLIASGAATPEQFRPSLRVVRSSRNEAARAEMPHIPKQWRVPTTSLISLIYRADDLDHLIASTAEESLGDWSTSSGSALPDLMVVVEARRFSDRVLALVSKVC